MSSKAELEMMPHILLVDDDPAKRLSLEGVLAPLPFQLISAASAGAAFKELLRRDFAVLVLDVRLPEMDGFELAALIRQRPRFANTPVVFVSAVDESDFDDLASRGLGRAEFAPMPVVAETFRAQIMRLAAPEGGTPPQAKSTEPVAPARAEGVEQLTQMLERSDRELDAFIYSVSHDVRTPLKTAQTFCGLLKEESGGQLSERAQEYLQYLEAGLQRADRMVGGLLQLSRTARAPLQREPVDMALLARSILPELDQTRVGATEIRLPESLPVEADARLLGTMLKHLLENALKFTSRRDAPVIELAEADGVYRLSDNGAGFDAERVDRLFLPFQRLHPPDDFPGTGVGLATVQRIVHRHGGRVWIEGAVDQGATVFWTLPV